MPACQRGTGQEIDDLRRDVRLEWWRRHGAAVTVPIFALVTTPRRERISPLMCGRSTRTLARVEPRNDGNLLIGVEIAEQPGVGRDLVVPHWTVATPFAQELPLGSALFDDAIPRTRSSRRRWRSSTGLCRRRSGRRARYRARGWSTSIA